MTLVRLQGFRGLGPAAPQAPRAPSGQVPYVDPAPEAQGRAPAPFGSWYEYFVWLYIQKRNPYWQPQTPFGRQGTRGSTQADFYNPVLRVAIFVDGARFHTTRKRSASDAYITAWMLARGIKPVRWVFYSLADVKRLTPIYYNRDIGF